MSVDFQVTFPQEVIQLNTVKVVSGSNPLTLDVVGKDFRSVDEVVINDIASPNVTVLSKTRLLAEVPEIVSDGFQPMRILVLSRNLTITPRSILKFKIGRTPSKVRGILKLIQLFLRVLFTTPGSDIFSPRLGAAALKAVGSTFGKDQTGAIVSDFIVAVDTASRQIVGLQGRDPSLPLDERLLAAKVRSANFDPSQAALIVSVEVTSQAGTTAQTNVVV